MSDLLVDLMTAALPLSHWRMREISSVVQPIPARKMMDFFKLDTGSFITFFITGYSLTNYAEERTS